MMFSVVIPLYNKEVSIKDTIYSVLNQSYQNFEIIVVNDGSTDNSLNIVSSISDSRIRIVNKKNGGVSSARNLGIREAFFDWIAFLDGDDIWETFHLEEIVKMQKLYPSFSIYVTSFHYSNSKVDQCKLNSNIYKVDDYFKEGMSKHVIWTCIIAVHRDCFRGIGYFDEKLKYGEDLDMWTRLAREYEIIKSERITCTYRIEAENRSNLNYDLNKSRVYYIDFNDCISESDVLYHKKQLISTFRSFFVLREFNNFFKLYRKYCNRVSLVDIFLKK